MCPNVLYIHMSKKCFLRSVYTCVQHMFLMFCTYMCPTYVSHICSVYTCVQHMFLTFCIYMCPAYVPHVLYIHVSHICVPHMFCIYMCPTNVPYVLYIHVCSICSLCSVYTCVPHMCPTYVPYGVATISGMLENIGLFCKRALQKRPVFCKETCIFKHPTNRSHPITYNPHSYVQNMS